MIAVLGGTGAEGSGLALRWAHAGYPVIIGSRNADKAEQVCAQMNATLKRSAVSHDSYLAAATAAQIIVLCVPYAAQRATVADHLNVGFISKPFQASALTARVAQMLARPTRAAKR